MRPAQISAQEVIAVLRRRWKLIAYATALVLGLSTIGAFILPRKYESSTTIMVQRDEVLNPLISFTMAVTTASEDRLRTFNEIIYSRITIQELIDSLQLDQNLDLQTEIARQELVKTVSKNISTQRPGPATFKLSYLDTDPVRAKNAVTFLADCFIKKTLQVENQRNELAVEFFEKKLEELKQKFESSQNDMVTLLRSRLNEMPIESRVVSSRIEDTEKQLGAIDDQIKSYQHALSELQTFPGTINGEQGKQILYDIQRRDLPYATDLRPLLTRYDDLTQRYTAKYPEAQKVERQILDLLPIMQKTIESEIVKEQKQRWEYDSRRSKLVMDLEKLSVTQEIDKEKESNVGLYRGLYDEMKIKLEQARTSRDLGRKGGEQFIAIDPPTIPTEPSKPNRLLIVIGGGVLGLFLGLLAILTTEILDTRIRSQKDLSIYRKRVIAYIQDGNAQ